MKASGKGMVFFVRMWSQGGDSQHSREWRGSILEIESGQLFYVTGTPDVADVIEARIADQSGRMRIDSLPDDE